MKRHWLVRGWLGATKKLILPCLMVILKSMVWELLLAKQCKGTGLVYSFLKCEPFF